jgi:hypothetical protein
MNNYLKILTGFVFLVVMTEAGRVHAQTSDTRMQSQFSDGQLHTQASDIHMQTQPFDSQILAQTFDGETDSTVGAPVQSVVFQEDSAARAAAAHARLLPKNISFGERLMWGDNGIMRGIGIVPALTPEERKFELSLRRTMLTTHQIGGFVSLGLMMATAYYGQQVLNGHRDLLPTHKAFISATIVSYTATGLLSVLSPPPLIRRDENSTTTLHKTLAWVHVAGMILTPIIGGMLRHSQNYDQIARFHQISGYVTTATFAASMIVVTF